MRGVSEVISINKKPEKQKQAVNLPVFFLIIIYLLTVLGLQMEPEWVSFQPSVWCPVSGFL